MKKYALILVLMLSLYGCGGKEYGAAFTGATMGTSYSIKIVELPSGVDDTDLQTQVDSLLDEVNRQMSTWREDSEISKFNSLKDTVWFETSPDFVFVVSKALEISTLTSGAFDITVGPLVNLWGFGPEQRSVSVPSNEEIAERMSITGYNNIEVSFEPPALKKLNPEIQIDLSAIAKGFGVDKVALFLEDKGLENFMVEIGGEVRTKGNNAEGQVWKIGIAAPSGEPGVQNVLGISGVSVATSGDYHNYFEQDGKRYSHTIDPRTGRPITHSLASVTVIYENCMTADAYATAIDVMGETEGYRFAMEQELPVYLIVKNDEEGFEDRKTSGFDEYMINKENN